MSSDAIARPVRAVVNRFGFVYLLGADGARLATIYGSRAERGARALAIAAALNGDDAGGAAAIGAAPEPAGDPAPALARLACDTVAAGRPCTYPACGCTAMSTYIMPLIAAGWRPPPEPQAPRDALERGIQRVMSMPLPEPQAAAPSADWLRRKIATDPDMDADAGGPAQAAASGVVEGAKTWLAAHQKGLAAHFARGLLAEHARAEAAERDLKLAQVGLFHDSDGAQYSLLETKKILREREAAEAAVKRLTEASWLYIAEWAKAVGAAQAAEERATVAEAAIVTARAALTPAGGGDGR